MNAYSLVITEKVYKELDRLHKKDQIKILAALQHLTCNPFIGKKLEGQFSGYYSIRIWPYRALYSIDHDTISITIVRVGHRKDVYQ